LKVRLHSRVAFGALIMIVGTLFIAMIAIRFLLPPSSAALPPATILNSDGPSPATSLSLPACPPAGIQPLQPSSQTGHHKVVLSWNANASSPDPEVKTVGYCLYRSSKQHAAKNNPTCHDCEQINPAPIVGTGCVDDLVLDSATYYYAVTAINAKGKISAAMSEALAPIPPGKQSAKSVPATSYPLCRSSANSK
jgi:hypothetical protein